MHENDEQYHFCAHFGEDYNAAMPDIRPTYAGSRLWRRLGRASLRSKIAGLVALAVLAMGLTTLLVVHAYVAASLRHALDLRAGTFARITAAHHADAMAAGQHELSHQAIMAMVQDDGDALYAVVEDAAGDVMLEAVRAGAPPDAVLGRPHAPGEGEAERLIRTSAGPVHEAVAPVPGLEAWVRVGLGETTLNATLAALDARLATAIAALLALSAAIAVALTGLITRPILHLKRAVRSASLAHLPERTEPSMEDEIGELTRAFNQMTDKLVHSRDALVAQNRELTVLGAMAQAISSSLEIEAVLRAALEAVLQHLALPAGWIFLAEFGQDRPLSLAVQIGLEPASAQAETELDFAECVCVDVLRTGQCQVVGDIERDCRRLVGGTRPLRLVTHISVPLVARDHVVGVLSAAAATAREFRPEERQLLEAVGRQLGVAVDNARLWDQVRRKEHLRGQLLERLMRAQEEERRRIALELHDQTGGSLASLGVGLRMLEDSAPLPRAARRQVADLKAQVATIAQELHQLALELRPAALDRLGLVDAVEQGVHAFARQHGLAADFHAQGLGPQRLRPEVETALYRVVQEALTNVARHACATEVAVLLERRAGSVVAVIEDNGCGFDVEAALSTQDSRLGLFGMQERAALVGGRLQIESSAAGTTVFVEVPAGEEGGGEGMKV
jgi:signal transduction histidine kinase